MNDEGHCGVRAAHRAEQPLQRRKQDNIEGPVALAELGWHHRVDGADSGSTLPLPARVIRLTRPLPQGRDELTRVANLAHRNLIQRIRTAPLGGFFFVLITSDKNQASHPVSSILIAARYGLPAIISNSYRFFLWPAQT